MNPVILLYKHNLSGADFVQSELRFRVKGLNLVACRHPRITFWARNHRKDKERGRCTAELQEKKNWNSY